MTGSYDGYDPETVVRDVLDENPAAVHDFEQGEQGAKNYLVGQVMAKTGGAVDPSRAIELIDRALNPPSDFEQAVEGLGEFGEAEVVHSDERREDDDEMSSVIDISLPERGSRNIFAQLGTDSLHKHGFVIQTISRAPAPAFGIPEEADFRLFVVPEDSELLD